MVGTNSAVLTHFLKCLQLLFWAICSRHIALYISRSWKTTNKRPNECAAKSGKTVTVTDESNHLSSSSNSPHLSLSLSLTVALSLSIDVFTSLTLLSLHPRSPFPHGRGLSAQSVCSGCVWPYACMCILWLWVSMCTWVTLYTLRVLWSSRGCRQMWTFWAGVLHLYLYLQTDDWKQNKCSKPVYSYWTNNIHTPSNIHTHNLLLSSICSNIVILANQELKEYCVLYNRGK